MMCVRIRNYHYPFRVDFNLFIKSLVSYMYKKKRKVITLS